MRINVYGLTEKNLRIFLLAQNAAQWSRNFSGRKRTSRHLVQQRLKKMKIPAVNQRDFDGRALQLLRRCQSPKPAAENDDSMFLIHAPRFPKRNLTRSSIISFTAR